MKNIKQSLSLVLISSVLAACSGGGGGGVSANIGDSGNNGGGSANAQFSYANTTLTASETIAKSGRTITLTLTPKDTNGNVVDLAGKYDPQIMIFCQGCATGSTVINHTSMTESNDVYTFTYTPDASSKVWYGVVMNGTNYGSPNLGSVPNSNDPTSYKLSMDKWDECYEPHVDTRNSYYETETYIDDLDGEQRTRTVFVGNDVPAAGYERLRKRADGTYLICSNEDLLTLVNYSYIDGVHTRYVRGAWHYAKETTSIQYTDGVVSSTNVTPATVLSYATVSGTQVMRSSISGNSENPATTSTYTYAMSRNDAFKSYNFVIMRNITLTTKFFAPGHNLETLSGIFNSSFTGTVSGEGGVQAPSWIFGSGGSRMPSNQISNITLN